MAEYFVGPVMEKLIDACFEYLKDQVRWQTGMKEELQSLRKIHPQIKAVVSAYSKAQIDDPELNKWYWQLRDAIDEADDVFDEFEYSKREKQVSKKRKISKVRSLMKSLKKRFVKIYKRALKIDPCLKRLEEAVHNLYEVSDGVSNFLRLLDRENQAQQQQQLELHRTRETGSSIKNVLLGRSEEMEFFREWLRNPCQSQVTDTTRDLYRNISVLSVVGHGGMGKTTLLQHVYKDGLKEVFDVKIWVCVSTNFDANMVIKNILESLKKERPNMETLEALQSCLESEVMSKRFLLVMDDIWEADETKWGNVIAPLHCGSSGSKILITTRMDSVALMFAKMIKNNQIRKLEGLGNEECLRLFNTHAFAGVENPSGEFISIAREIVKKFSGCPLVAKVVGGILNDYMDEQYWKKVLTTNFGNLESSQNDLLPILKLSYTYLPDYLQNCFAFCCMFPEDYQFEKDDLVRMWIALDFIQSSNILGETLVDKGRRYFNILVQKSFFDEFHTYDDKVCYKMHDLLHELAQSVSTQECFKVMDDKEFSNPPETIRHLSINTSSLSGLEAAFQKMGKFKNLRSLLLSISAKIDENVISKIFKALRSIRLLVITGIPSVASIPCHFNMPETISYLIHLRYLKFNHYDTLKLPRSISHLYHLQFVLCKRLEILEMDIIGLKELKDNENCQLMIHEFVIKDPSELLMETLRSICSFPALTIEENDELVSFPRETEQWFLQHGSSLHYLRFDKLKSLQSLPSSLESLSSLQTLVLSNLESLQCLPPYLSTVSFLKHLHLKNIPLLKSLPELPSSLTDLFLVKFESLRCLPSSLSTISSLTDIALINIPLIKSLPDLPSSLKKLYLQELESLQSLPSCLPTTLNSLVIIKVPRLLELPGLPSSLNFLELKELESLQSLPSCLHTTLYELWISKVPQLLELPDLPSSLKFLQLRELESLQCLPSCLRTTLNSLGIMTVPRLLELPDLPSSLKFLRLKELESLQSLPFCLHTTLYELWIHEVPRLLELPDLPASLKYLSIEGCHPQLMERYPNVDRRR